LSQLGDMEGDRTIGDDSRYQDVLAG